MRISPRVTVSADIEPGKPLRIVKFLSYGWSRTRSLPAVRDQVAAALAEAQHRGWDRLAGEQREYLDDFWKRADVELEGDAELQQAVRFALFHVLQAGARAEQRAIPAKGLTGSGYDGHAFWDTEAFVLPVLTYTAPQAAADALRWRHQTLDLARERAAGAWPSRWRFSVADDSWAGVLGLLAGGDGGVPHQRRHRGCGAQVHCAADDEAFDREVGTELLVETARLWRSLGHHDAAGRFRIDGMTGPDEYSAVADNNVYTNLMAQQNLRAAADAVERRPELAAELGVDEEESASWRDAAETVVVPYDDELGMHPQADGFLQYDRWDFKATPPRALSAVPALPVLRAVPQAGRQAGRPRAGDAPARRRVHG